MPGLSGIELARYLLGLQSRDEGAVYVGLSRAFEDVRLQPGDNFIEKPFTAPQLLLACATCSAALRLVGNVRLLSACRRKAFSAFQRSPPVVRSYVLPPNVP